MRTGEKKARSEEKGRQRSATRNPQKSLTYPGGRKGVVIDKKGARKRRGGKRLVRV